MTMKKLLSVSTLAAAALALTIPTMASAGPRHHDRYDHHRPHKVRVCRVERRGHHHVRVCHWVRR